MTKLKDQIEKIFKDWYKGYEDEKPNEYCINQLLSLFTKTIKEAMPKLYKEEMIDKYSSNFPGSKDSQETITRYLYNQALKDLTDNLRKKGILLKWVRTTKF